MRMTNDMLETKMKIRSKTNKIEFTIHIMTLILYL